MKNGTRLRTNKNITDFRTKQELHVTHELSGLRSVCFKQIGVDSGRPPYLDHLQDEWGMMAALLDYKSTLGNQFNTLEGWLHLNDVSASGIRSLLRSVSDSRNTLENAPLTNSDACPKIGAHEAWLRASDALAWKFSDQADLVSEVASRTDVEFVENDDGVRRPYTLDRGSDAFPFVSICFNGSAADILAVAHEFGHAVQLAANPGTFIPPIHREVAAFLSELAIIDFLKAQGDPIAGGLCKAHVSDDAIYLDRDVKALEAALCDPKAAYDYRWNYPVARLLVARLFQRRGQKDLWSDLLGKNAVSELLEIGPGESTLNKVENYLPAAPEPDKDHPAINGYRSLGMMALLDIDYWQGESENLIGDYYLSHVDHLNGKTAMIAFSEDKKPIGYATWTSGPDNADDILVTRQAAPFGDHLSLQKKLKSRLSETAQITSRHSRSARGKQIVW